MIEVSRLTTVAITAALKAGALLKRGFGSHFEISEKEGYHNLVTEYDKATEKQIISSIFSHFPDHAHLAEEGGLSKGKGSPYMWVIDPLDGTVNFAHNIPIFSVSIACTFENEVICGVVYQPMTEELFIAEKGRGATLNGSTITVTKTPRLESSILVTEFPYNAHENPLNCVETFSRLTKMGLPIRRLGSAALDLSYVAAGRFDGFWEVSLEPWDLAAGKLIVEEAGGRVTHYDGTPHNVLEKGTLLATNGHIHNTLQQVINDN